MYGCLSVWLREGKPESVYELDVSINYGVEYSDYLSRVRVNYSKLQGWDNYQCDEEIYQERAGPFSPNF